MVNIRTPSGFSKRSTEFTPTCPADSKWYACGPNTHFVGCCASDPCEKGCSEGNTQPAQIDPEHYGNYTDASCGVGANFYSCVAGETFWGCCKSMPCDTGECPKADLTPAFMDQPAQFEAYLPSGSSSAADSSSKTPTGAIIGGAVGGGLGLALIVGFLVWYWLRARKSRAGRNDTAENHYSEVPRPAGEKSGAYRPNSGVPPPPGYTSKASSPYLDSPATFHYAHQQDFGQQPQELPAFPITPASGTLGSKPLRPVEHRYSELPGEAAIAELASPHTSPHLGVANYRSELESPQTSPHIGVAGQRSELESPVASPNLGPAVPAVSQSAHEMQPSPRTPAKPSSGLGIA